MSENNLINEKERKMYDSVAKRVDIDKLNPYLVGDCVVIPESVYSMEQLGNIEGANIFDLGCGTGETSVYLALKGAYVQTVDISPEMIAVTRKLSEKYGVEKKVKAEVANLETIDFPENTFDIVYGQDVLHHINCDIVFPKIHKILKKNGFALFVEPLDENVIINLFRKLTPDIHTPDEHPFRIEDIERYGKIFSKYEYKYFQLFTLAIFFWMWLSEIFKKKKTRYWLKIVEERKRYKSIFLVLQAIEDRVFKIMPFLSKYCRMAVIKFIK